MTDQSRAPTEPEAAGRGARATFNKQAAGWLHVCSPPRVLRIPRALICLTLSRPPPVAVPLDVLEYTTDRLPIATVARCAFTSQNQVRIALSLFAFSDNLAPCSYP